MFPPAAVWTLPEYRPDLNKSNWFLYGHRFYTKEHQSPGGLSLCLCLSGSAISRPIPAADGAAAWWRGRRARGCDARHEGSWRRRSNNSVPLQLHDTFTLSSYEDVLSIHIQLTTRFHNKVKEMLNKRNKSVVKLVEIRLRLSASPVLPRYLLSALMFVQPDSTQAVVKRHCDLLNVTPETRRKLAGKAVVIICGFWQ